MGTRAIICMKHFDNHLGILCNMDGYPDHALEILEQYYNNHADIYELISGGDIRTIYKNYTPNPLGHHDLEDSQPNVTTVYLRDTSSVYTDEELEKFKISYGAVVFDIDDFTNVEKFKYYDYLYVYDGVKWKCEPKYSK